MMKTLSLTVLAALVAAGARAQTADPCSIPAGVNPYYTQPPPECASRLFNPYLLPPAGPAIADPGATAFLFTGGVVNPDTLTYLDLWNASYASQTIRVEYDVPGQVITRTVTLPPRGSTSVEVHADPALAGRACSFAVQVTFEHLGVAALTLRPAAAPWSSAITPTPRILDLAASAKP